MGRGRKGGRGGRGGGGGRGAKRQHSEGGGGDERSVRPRTDAWKTPEQIESNGLFEEYYKEHNVCPPEEWDDFILCLKTPLPITFRINGGGQFADRLREKLETDFMAQFAAGETLMVDGEPAEPPHPLGWYPGGLAWQMNFSRKQLRKAPVLAELHEFMKRENETGSITRQEAVSMVPPLFMDVEPHHWVLDMCAAPGSKTFQLLEMLHGGPAAPTGLIAANDADAMRCNLLAHQTKRMCSPHLVVTNHEAQAWPLLRNLVPGSSERHVLFDRVLCDVPCSGDGTMRKAPDIWRRWSTANGIGLHLTQLRIALRACELLRVGGRMVYSTCTFNPVENEAVVAEVLRRTKGAFELVDGSDHLPHLRRMPGKQRWRVRDRDGWYDSWEEGKKASKLQPSMFPDAASDSLPLHLCMRFLPHHQNTGGFFVAVLKKVGELERPLEMGCAQNRPQQAQPKVAEEAMPAAQEEVPAAAPTGQAGAAEAAATAENGDAAPVEAPAAPGAAASKAEAGAASEAAAGAAAIKAEATSGAEVAGAGAEAGAVGTVGPAADAAGEDRAADRGAGAGKLAWQRKAEDDVGPGLPEWRTIRGGGVPHTQGGGRYKGVDPVTPYVDADQLAAMRAFYGFAPDSPLPEAMISRSVEQRPKKLYCVGPSVKLLLQLDTKEQLKIIGAGVKILERQDSRDGLVPCLYRFTQEGLPAILPHVTKQRFHPTVDEMLALLQHRSVGLPQGHKLHITKGGAKAAAGEAGTAPAAAGPAEPQVDAKGEDPQQEASAPAASAAGQAAQPAAGEAALQPAAAAPTAAAPAGGGKEQAKQPRVTLTDPSTVQQLEGLAMGCCVALLRSEDAAALGFAAESDAAGGLAAAAPLAVACWRGRGSINVLVSKVEGDQMVDKLKHHRTKAAAAAAAPVADKEER